MATTRTAHTIAPQLEISLHRRASDAPVIGRLELAQARELIGRLSLVDPEDSGVSAAMKGPDPSRLLLGLQSFYRLVLERDGYVALAAVDGSLWTITARAVEAVTVRLVTGVVSGPRGRSPVPLPATSAAADDG
jgi:hypothetical protein